jgi:DNA polymerase-3 subunit alpha
MSASFVHLHVHSEYSLSDGIVRIDPLVRAAADGGMPAVALTDQNNLFALVKFYRAALAAGVKPIAGADLWVRDGRDPRQLDRVLLLCQDEEGYRNLSRLLSRAWYEGQDRGVAAVRDEWLDGHTRGLIALSGGRQGEVGRSLLAGHERRARRQLERWMERFDGRFYLEAVRTGRDGENSYLRGAARLGASLGCPLAATNDVRFLSRDDFDTHEARVCIHDGRTLDDPRRPRSYTAEQYLKTPEEMADLFADLPGALENTVEIARRCNLEMHFGTYHLPAFPTPAGRGVDEHLRDEAGRGLTERLERHGMAEGFGEADYRSRLDEELEVILQMGFPGYFLIVADFIRWAREHDIPVGPGRGSGAGSLVAYCLGITSLDPLRYNLLFERFLNPERVSMPDFDVDFCMEKRDRVIDYVADRYGREKVGQIITFGSMAARAVVRDAGRVLGHPYGFVDRIAKLIPFQVGITLDEALKEDDELKQVYRNEDDARDVIDLARSLEGLARNPGRHAGGVVIASGDLKDFMPLFFEANGGAPVTQFDKDDVEAIGLVKFDFLGLRTLTIIDWAVASVNEVRQAAGETPVDISAIPLDDGPTFELLRECRSTAVFQLESRGMKDLIRRLRPDSFEEIIALVALFRPGPLQSGMVDDFIDRKHGRAQVDYPHPKLKPILEPTYGVILYQEQVMQIAQVLAGYSLGGADLLRRAMGKKKASEMAKQRAIFVEGATERGVDAGLANQIFDLMEKFAGYGFNKSHSAAYALIAYQTAWLKTHYPAPYMAAVLSADLDHTDKIVVMIEECRSLELDVRRPDVNSSSWFFRARDGKRIDYGLGAIKGVGRAAVDSIVASREEDGPFEDLNDFCRRVDLSRVNRRVMEALIQAGALDGLGPNRATLMAALPEALSAAEQASRDATAGQSDIFGGAVPVAPAADVAEQPEWDEDRRLRGERETLGLYLTGHPIDRFEGELAHFITCRLGEMGEHVKGASPDGGNGYRRAGTPVVIAGLITAVRKRGGRMAFVTLDDKTGRAEVALFDDAFRRYAELLTPDRIVVVEGTASVDDFSGGYRISAKQVWELDEARARMARGVEILLNGAGPEGVERICSALRPFRSGKAPVWVEFRGDRARARLKLGEEWRVRASGDLLESLAGIQGVESTRILY